MYDNKIKLKILNMYHFIKVVNFHYLCTASIIIHFFFFYQIILLTLTIQLPNEYNCRRVVYA